MLGDYFLVYTVYRRLFSTAFLPTQVMDVFMFLMLPLLVNLILG